MRRLTIIRALRSTLAHLVDLLDAIASAFLAFGGRANPIYLNRWEVSLGPRTPPKFPPKQIPCTPHYRYSRLDFNARDRAAVVLTYVPTEIVKKALPDLLELEPVPDAPPGKHPVMLSFGVNSKFSAVFTPWQLRTVTYLEFLSSIPNTQLKDCGKGYCGPFLYPPRLWASRLLPVLVGKALAFPKKYARIDGGPESFTICRVLNGETIATLKVTPVGHASPSLEIKDALPWCSRVNQPIMTETGSREPLFCHFQFEWDLSFGQPADISLTVKDDEFPLLSPGDYHFPALRDGSGGGLLIASPCHLQLPFPRFFLETVNAGPCEDLALSQHAASNRELHAERAADKTR